MNGPNRATIVVGVDGSTSALHAALWVADEATPRHLPDVGRPAGRELIQLACPV
jgi:hypothetical protein